MAKNFKCADVLGEARCARLKELAAKIKIKAAEVDKVLKEIVAKGITKIHEIIQQIKEKLFPALNEEEYFW